jgi:hypothetical protein
MDGTGDRRQSAFCKAAIPGKGKQLQKSSRGKYPGVNIMGKYTTSYDIYGHTHGPHGAYPMICPCSTYFLLDLCLARLARPMICLARLARPMICLARLARLPAGTTTFWDYFLACYPFLKLLEEDEAQHASLYGIAF